jgi:hypothetical protein
MKMFSKLQAFVPHLECSLRRFPVPILVTVALFSYVNAFTIGNFSNAYYYVEAAALAAFLAGGIGHLAAESFGFSKILNLGFATVCAFSAAAIMYFNITFATGELFFFAALFLMLMIAPFLNPKRKQGALWLYDLHLGLAIILAIIVGGVFGGGLSAVLAGLDFLFGIKISGDAYQRVWSAALILVGPLYGLALIPTDLTEEIDLGAHRGGLVERGVSVLVNFVMVPLALVYALLLHAYAVKIVTLGSLPKGEIGWIVSLFAIGGTATWLIGWPWRDSGTWLLQKFMRAWFWLLPVPAILLTLAIWRRVSDYGVTPDRYGIALVAVWTAMVFAYLVLRKNKADMRIIIGVAAFLLLIGSFGPQGAYHVTGVSQFSRLTKILTDKGILKDGVLVASVPNVPDSDGRTISSILWSLNTVHALEPVKNLVGGVELSPDLKYFNSNYAAIGDIEHKLGVNLMVPSETEVVSFNAQLAIDQRWTGATRLIGPLTVANYDLTARLGKTVVTLDEKQLHITIDGRDATIETADLMAKLKLASKGDSSKTPVAPIVITPKITLLVTQAYGNAGAGAKITSLEFWIVSQD